MCHMPLLRVTHSVCGSELLDKNYSPKQAPGGNFNKLFSVVSFTEISLQLRYIDLAFMLLYLLQNPHVTADANSLILTL